jgi:hypothetical protein
VHSIHPNNSSGQEDPLKMSPQRAKAGARTIGLQELPEDLLVSVLGELDIRNRCRLGRLRRSES